MNEPILVDFEESQAVTIAFRQLGYEAYSCDLLPCSGGHPEWHIQGDAIEAINSRKWACIIMHPPCTKICVSGNGTYGVGKPRHSERIWAVSWTLQLWKLAVSVCDHVSLENPVGVLNKYTLMPKPQYIQPWQFGHGETKKQGYGFTDCLRLLLPTLLKVASSASGTCHRLLTGHNNDQKPTLVLHKLWQANGVTF